MKITFLIYIFLLCLSCQKEENILKPNSKLKTKFIYSDSKAEKPYSFTSYIYDKDWNLIKESISDCPNPLTSYYTYEYSGKGKLLSKKYFAKQGLKESQTESEFKLIREYKYDYTDNKQFISEYRNNEFTDSSLFIYNAELLMEEIHISFRDSLNWNILYEYNSKNNLVKRTSMPDGTYTIYNYENSKLKNTLHYNNKDSLLIETSFTYTKSGNIEITEIYTKGPYGDYISAKITTQNGNVTEYINYHPTFQGAEWWCERYDYY